MVSGATFSMTSTFVWVDNDCVFFPPQRPGAACGGGHRKEGGEAEGVRDLHCTLGSEAGQGVLEVLPCLHPWDEVPKQPVPCITLLGQGNGFMWHLA